ncbi:MAG: HlyC/CorC family transporter [Methanothrix sp.]|jgi:putative hemolysin|nr:HlyC/CorC family transporter [Methanothrix sp.]
MNFEIVVIILLIIVNGLFAMSEIAVVSSRRSRLQELAEGGDGGAEVALDLAEEPTAFLSTIQIGITLVGTLAGAYGGATVAKELAGWLEAVPALASHSVFLSVGIVVIGITYAMLILGELVPKRVALNDPERIASIVAAPLRFFSRAAAPIVFLLSGSTNVVITALGIRPNNGPPVTEEEIKILIDLGAGAGVFEEAEKEMVDRVFRLGDRKAATLMTPRSEIVWLDASDTPDMIKEKVSGRAYTLFPVCNGDLDNVMGVVHAKDLLFRTEGVEKVQFDGVLFPALFVPESMRGLKVLERFKETGIHLAIVVDEYGEVEGVVTLTDLLEAIVGDIPNIDELTEPSIIQRGDGSWLVDGMISIDDFKENFDVEKMPEEDAGVYQTLGGFAMTQFERIPSSGDHFEWGDLRFEVVDMDSNRVDKLLITPLNRPDGEYGQ